MAVVDLEFRAMASVGYVQVVGGGIDLARQASWHATDLEEQWSRFIPTSDVSRLNAAGGRPVVVSPETIQLVETMVRAWHLTGGRFDPTILPALVASGYGASIDDPQRTTELREDVQTGGDLDAIEIDRDRSTVTLPIGLTLDPGGLGKGLAADLIAGGLLGKGATGALVSIGGDLAAHGRGPDGEWLVVVEHPGDPGVDLCTLAIDEGGVATSSILSRRWTQEGIDRHHLIDPRRGEQATTDLQAVTVVAPTGWQAECFATAALLGGGAEALPFFEAHDVDGIAVMSDGRIISTIPSIDGQRPMQEV